MAYHQDPYYGGGGGHHQPQYNQNGGGYGGHSQYQAGNQGYDNGYNQGYYGADGRGNQHQHQPPPPTAYGGQDEYSPYGQNPWDDRKDNSRAKHDRHGNNGWQGQGQGQGGGWNNYNQQPHGREHRGYEQNGYGQAPPAPHANGYAERSDSRQGQGRDRDRQYNGWQDHQQHAAAPPPQNLPYRQRHDERPPPSRGEDSRKHRPHVDTNVKPPKPVPRILADGMKSPETLAWDNPFPTFPTPKKNNSRSTTPQPDEHPAQHDNRPATAHSKGSQGSGGRDRKQHLGGPAQNGGFYQNAGNQYGMSNAAPAAVSDPGLIPADEPPVSSQGYGQPHHADQPSRNPASLPRSQSDQSRWQPEDQARSGGSRQGHYNQPTGNNWNHQPQGPNPAYNAHQPYSAYRQTSEEEMPNFEAASDPSHQRGLAIDPHLQPQSQSQGSLPPTPTSAGPYATGAPYGQYGPPDVPRSQSQPNFSQPRNQRPSPSPGYGYGAPPPDRRPATSAADDGYGGYGPRHPGGYPNDRRHPPNARPRHDPRGTAGPRSRDRPPDPRAQGRERLGPGPPRASPGQNRPDAMRPPPGSGPSPPQPNGAQPPPSNPDTLPHHPVPIRPGLAQNRPAPVRNYNSPPADPVQRSKQEAVVNTRAVTPQELEDLRQRTLRNPNDNQTQILLANKLIEAADVLVDDRADPATRKRTRDRYQADALKIIKKLSSLGNADADFIYADSYSRGALGLPSDIKEAFLLYQKAAKANHAQAAYRVAVCCEIGQEEGGGTKRDPVKAMQWYKRAATLGDVAAMYKLGVIQLKGLLGQPRDIKDAITWLKKAADKADSENPHALHELGLLFEKQSGTDGPRQDEQRAMQYFMQAAALGYKFSQFRLGCCYEYGLLGCPADPRQSIAWYSKAAVQEEHQAELALSGWYLTGAEDVLAQSDTEAYLWARKAAQSGLAKAEYAMGYFTEVGIGAPANLEDAKRWYWKSSAQNFPKARERLEDLRRGNAPKKARVSRSNMRKQSDGECSVM